MAQIQLLLMINALLYEGQKLEKTADHSIGSARKDASTRLVSHPIEKTLIIGGEDVKTLDYPFMVRANGCGASLIAPSYIMTAAHCSDALGLEVTLGTVEWDEGKKHKIVDRIFYQESSLNDVMVAEISPPVDYASPVYLDTGFQGFSEPGTENKVIGWGDTKGGPEVELPSTLQEMTGRILTNKECQSACNDNWWPYDFEICLQSSPYHIVAEGDSGSPMFYELNGQFIQTGIVKGANFCQRYGIFARISSYALWLQQVAPGSKLSDELMEGGGNNTVYPEDCGCKLGESRPNRYIKGNACASLGKFWDLGSAEKKCCECEECHGITYTPSNKEYSLRSGNCMTKSLNGEISWKKTE